MFFIILLNTRITIFSRPILISCFSPNLCMLLSDKSCYLSLQICNSSDIELKLLKTQFGWHIKIMRTCIAVRLSAQMHCSIKVNSLCYFIQKA